MNTNTHEWQQYVAPVMTVAYALRFFDEARNTVSDRYLDYQMIPKALPLPNGRFAVGVEVTRQTSQGNLREMFYAQDGISYILEIEAQKEGLNLARNLIDRNMVGF